MQQNQGSKQVTPARQDVIHKVEKLKDAVSKGLYIVDNVLLADAILARVYQLSSTGPQFHSLVN